MKSFGGIKYNLGEEINYRELKRAARAGDVVGLSLLKVFGEKEKVTLKLPKLCGNTVKVGAVSIKLPSGQKSKKLIIGVESIFGYISILRATPVHPVVVIGAKNLTDDDSAHNLIIFVFPTLPATVDCAYCWGIIVDKKESQLVMWTKVRASCLLSSKFEKLDSLHKSNFYSHFFGFHLIDRPGQSIAPLCKNFDVNRLSNFEKFGLVKIEPQDGDSMYDLTRFLAHEFSKEGTGRYFRVNKKLRKAFVRKRASAAGIVV